MVSNIRVSEHLTDVDCGGCSLSRKDVNVNTDPNVFWDGPPSAHVNTVVKCPACSITEFYPLVGGSTEAQQLALAKTA